VLGWLAKTRGVIMKLEFVTKEEAEKIRRTMPKSKTMEEYEGYLKQLPENQVGKIVVSPKDGIKPQTVRSRLNRAGKSLELNIETKRIANTILFWRE
jgi:hypothetical protein